MFTGIITCIGRIERIAKDGDRRFTITAGDFARDAAIGASIACSGACLTVIEKGKDSFSVQASQETLARTTLGDWTEDTHINLERALKVGDELGGHFVSGHVDGRATLTALEPVGESMRLSLSAPADLCLFIAPKGSVTLDGVSLTVNEVKGDGFTVNIIPHTLKETTLGSRKAGDTLNLEVDLIARYLARQKQG